jgi:hypothetical protein
MAGVDMLNGGPRRAAVLKVRRAGRISIFGSR